MNIYIIMCFYVNKLHVTQVPGCNKHVKNNVQALWLKWISLIAAKQKQKLWRYIKVKRNWERKCLNIPTYHLQIKSYKFNGQGPVNLCYCRQHLLRIYNKPGTSTKNAKVPFNWIPRDSFWKKSSKLLKQTLDTGSHYRVGLTAFTQSWIWETSNKKLANHWVRKEMSGYR